MDRVAQKNKALLEAGFNSFAVKVRKISVQEEQTTPWIVFSRVDGKVDKHSPGENGLENQ